MKKRTILISYMYQGVYNDVFRFHSFTTETTKKFTCRKDVLDECEKNYFSRTNSYHIMVPLSFSILDKEKQR